jgi:secretion/DNA translocation related TadE-like protein
VNRLGDDRGAASIFVLAIGMALVSIGLAGATIGAARVARHQAKVAADFGALAGGPRAIEGEAAACAEARRYVEANHARMTACTVTGLDIVVRTEVRLEAVPANAEAASRAGPISGAAETEP